MRILVTGANGFVGSQLTRELLKHGFAVTATVRTGKNSPAGCRTVNTGDVGLHTDWGGALQDVDTVIHLAARAHILKENEAAPIKAFRNVNTEGTLNLATQAAEHGVRRFIFLSSIGVLGIHTNNRSPFTETDSPCPPEPYGISKWEAEQALQTVAAASGMETVIVRAPLIYGPGVKGNMQSLMKLAASGLPLPLGAVHNQRSLLYVGNLTDFIACCIDHPAAANETFLLSDNHDLSTTELLRKMRQAMNKAPRLIPVPASWFRRAGRLTGKSAVVNRLFGSLQVDCTKARTELEWQPPFAVEQGIQAMVDAI